MKELDDVPLGNQIQTFERNYTWEIYTETYAQIKWKVVVP